MMSTGLELTSLSLKLQPAGSGLTSFTRRLGELQLGYCMHVRLHKAGAAVLQSLGYNMQYSNALAPNKGLRRESTVEAKESDPHSAACTAPPPRQLDARYRLVGNAECPELSLCFLPALAVHSVSHVSLSLSTL